MVEKYTALTGATGFIGKNLTVYLNNSSIKTKSLTREELKGDISSKFDFDVIIHLAGKAHDLKKQSKITEYYEVNSELTKKLYDAFLQSNAKKFIFISSVKAVADKVNGTLTEDLVPQPQTHYGKSKLEAENYIISKDLPIGKSYYILRPCMTHGPGNKGNLNLLFKIINKGFPYPLAVFSNKRSFLSVENLCFIIKEIITRDDIPNGIYNASDNEALSTTEVVLILSEFLSQQPKLWRIPSQVINFLASLGDILHLPLNTDRLSKLTESYIVSNEKLMKTINKPLPFTARQGLEITATSFKYNNFNNPSN